MAYAADVLVALAFVAAGYWAWAAYRTHAFKRCRPAHSGFAPSVSVLKPLCGIQPGLYETLRSFCAQAYPEFQLVFGTNDPADRAVTSCAVSSTSFRASTWSSFAMATRSGRIRS